MFFSAPKPEKKFSFLNDFELAKMKEEEERRIANMTRAEFAKLTSSSPNCSALIDDQESRLADEETDKVRKSFEMHYVREHLLLSQSQGLHST